MHLQDEGKQSFPPPTSPRCLLSLTLHNTERLDLFGGNRPSLMASIQMNIDARRSVSARLGGQSRELGPRSFLSSVGKWQPAKCVLTRRWRWRRQAVVRQQRSWIELRAVRRGGRAACAVTHALRGLTY